MIASGTSFKPITERIEPKRQGAARHYGSHPYFTRRPWNVVQAYIQNFTRPEETVLDPFGGSGVTAVEALFLRRKAVHVDINPLANFITEQIAVAPVSLGGLAEAFQQVKVACLPAIRANGGRSRRSSSISTRCRIGIRETCDYRRTPTLTCRSAFYAASVIQPVPDLRPNQLGEERDTSQSVAVLLFGDGGQDE